jgi:predicted RNase H-like nuclease
MLDEATFIGVDLAWKSKKNPSGFAVAKGNRSGVSLCKVKSNGLLHDNVLAEIRANATDNTIVAVDAPLILRNSSGARECEKEVSRRFWKQQAGAYPSNTTMYPEAGGVILASDLEGEGFAHGLLEPRRLSGDGRRVIEVYPHPGMVRLFGLERTIKYKRGRVDKRRRGLSKLREILYERLVKCDPPLSINEFQDELLCRDLGSMKGGELKRYEDSLDAVFCSYLAAYFWRWLEKRNEVFGNARTGYIVIPKPSEHRNG